MTKLNMRYKNSKALLAPILDEAERPDFVRTDFPASTQVSSVVSATSAPRATETHNLIAQGKIELEKVIHFFTALVSTKSAAVINYAYAKAPKRKI